MDLAIVAAVGVVAVVTPPVQAATTSLASVSSGAVSPGAMSSGAVSSGAMSSSMPGADTSVTPSVTPRASAKGRKGQTLSVTPTRGLSPYGQTVTVRGSKFSEVVGIYVGLCVLPRVGAKPTPCGGGVDQDGSSQASAWISSNPPPYGANLAIPYKRGGAFSVRIKVSPRIGTVDCRFVRCAIVARADHTRANDRTWDVVVPVTFR